jgi:hypothetical protein
MWRAEFEKYLDVKIIVDLDGFPEDENVLHYIGKLPRISQPVQ